MIADNAGPAACSSPETEVPKDETRKPPHHSQEVMDGESADRDEAPNGRLIESLRHPILQWRVGRAGGHTIRKATTGAMVFLSDSAAYLAVRLLVASIQTLPLDMGDRMCRGLALLVVRVLGIRSGASETNIKRVFWNADRDARRRLETSMWHHLLLMVCEIAWAQRRLHRCNWSRHVRFRGSDAMLKQLLSRRPTVVVTGHFGNFEVGGYVNGLMGLSTTTIARKLDNRFLHEWVQRFRQSKGQEMVDKEGCAPLIDRHLRSGGTLSILADQHAGPKGCWVRFLGVPASCHKALALFSLTAEAPMLVGYTRRIGRRPMQFEIGCTGMVDTAGPGACTSVAKLTEWYNDRLAEAIELSVEQYWWLHRRWRKPPERVIKRLQRRAA